MNEIPVLDVGPYLAGEQGALGRLATELAAICQDVGFYHIVNHGVPGSLIESMFEQTARFHALPMSEKLKLRQGVDYVGYVPPDGVRVDAGDGFDNSQNKIDAQSSYNVNRDWPADHPLLLAGTRYHIRQPWPDEALLPGFRQPVYDYHHAMERLGRRLLPPHAQSLGLPTGFFDEAFRDPIDLTRMIYYPPVPKRAQNQFGLGAHTDIGFLTFLPQTEVAGLEIMLQDQRWIAQPSVPGALLVNLGQAFKRWTNNRYRATPHRVQTPVGDKPRYSVPFFFNPGYYTRIEAMPTCVDADHPAQQPPIMYWEHKDRYLANTYTNLGGGGDKRQAGLGR
jgi:isopenicillin N synthase-like dioxygenase